MNLEILARLTPGTMRYEQGSRTTGQKLTDADIAARLAKLSDIQMLIVDCKYMGYDQSKPKLIRFITRETKRVAKINHWRAKADLINKMAECAVYECVDPGKCSVCYGVGAVAHDTVSATCDTCKGTGIVKLTDKVRASSLGLNLNTYKSCWKHRYQDIVRKINNIDQGIGYILENG